MSPLLTSVAYISLLIFGTLSQSITTKRESYAADHSYEVTQDTYYDDVTMLQEFPEHLPKPQHQYGVMPGRIGGMVMSPNGNPGAPTNANVMHQQHRLRSPPINAFYELSIRIPVIGKQIFQLRILNENVAELIIDGMLQVNDVISYRVDQQSGDLSFKLSEETQGILRKFRTRLGKASYCSETDTPSIVVSPPLPTNINLKLERKHDHI